MKWVFSDLTKTKKKKKKTVRLMGKAKRLIGTNDWLFFILFASGFFFFFSSFIFYFLFWLGLNKDSSTQCSLIPHLAPKSTNRP